MSVYGLNRDELGMVCGQKADNLEGGGGGYLVAPAFCEMGVYRTLKNFPKKIKN
jgi:hypothetical protein